MTEDDTTIYVHAINRHFRRDLQVDIHLSALMPKTVRARQFLMTGRLKRAPGSGETEEISAITEREAYVHVGVLQGTLPARSLSILEVPK